VMELLEMARTVPPNNVISIGHMEFSCRQTTGFTSATVAITEYVNSRLIDPGAIEYCPRITEPRFQIEGS